MLVARSSYHAPWPRQSRRVLIVAGFACTVLVVCAFLSGTAYGASGQESDLMDERDSDFGLRGKGNSPSLLRRLRERLTQVEDDLVDEIARATAKENANTDAVTAEEARAAAAEAANAVAITANADAVTAEEARAVAEENANAVAITANADTITAEEARAVAKENANAVAITANADAITAEEARAEAAEDANAVAITANADAITAEEARAEAAEDANSVAITANADAIAAEEARALAAEALITGDIHHLGGAYACRPGYFRAEDDECKGCLAGQYLPVTGTSIDDCEPCAENFFSEVGFIECDPCVAPTPISSNGIDCVDACAAAPCQNGGTCSTDGTGPTYSCSCTEEYEGDNCETLKPTADPIVGTTSILAGGTGPGTFDIPRGLAQTAQSPGAFFVTSTWRVWKVDNGAFSQVVTGGLTDCRTIAMDSVGNMYLANAASHTVLKVTQAQLAAGGATATSFFTATAQVNYLAVRPSDNAVLVVSSTSVTVHNSGTGALEATYSTGLGLNDARGCVADANDNLYVANSGSRQVVKITPANPDVPEVLATFPQPSYLLGIALDAFGNVLVADVDHDNVRKIDVSTSTSVNAITGGVVTSLSNPDRLKSQPVHPLFSSVLCDASVLPMAVVFH